LRFRVQGFRVENMQIKASGITDAGLKRERNEDFYAMDESLGLYMVADGMGGHLAGEVASRVAVEMIHKSFRTWTGEKTPLDELFAGPDPSLSSRGNYILSSLRLANRVIHEMALEYEQYHGMGTTAVILLVQPDLLVAANVGDSRIYLVRNGAIERLSRDHTIVSEQIEMGMMTEEEASASPLRHILTRNLGSSEEVEPEVFELVPAERDRFILCSDGLTDLVKEDEMLKMTLEAGDPAQLCRGLLDMVLSRGAHDNTTIVSVFLERAGKVKHGAIGRIGTALMNGSVGFLRLARK
jgi:PPM family protein phosphatase